MATQPSMKDVIEYLNERGRRDLIAVIEAELNAVLACATPDDAEKPISVNIESSSMSSLDSPQAVAFAIAAKTGRLGTMR